jgi:hypothetical protein
MSNFDTNQNGKWRCVSKNSAIQVWQRIDTESESKQLQFRFGDTGNVRITTVKAEEKDIVEDSYEGRSFQCYKNFSLGGHTVWHGSLHAISYFSSLTESEINKLKFKRTIEVII